MAAKIWAVGSGKGGVGKSFVSSCLAITLSKLGNTVCLVDFDCSGANLHTSFGLSLARENLQAVIEGRCDFKSCIRPTNLPKISLVQGFGDSWQPVSLASEQTSDILRQAQHLPFDYVIFDLGSGSSDSYLEIFSKADEKLLISNSEPTAVEKNYRFLEAFIFHSLKSDLPQDQHATLREALRNYRSLPKLGSFSLKHYLHSEFKISFNYFEVAAQHPIRLIVNESRNRLDEDLGFSVKSVCKKYFDLPVQYLGHVDFDNAVWQAVKSREPFLIEKPFTPLAAQVLTICKHLKQVNSHANFYRAVV